MVLDPADPDSVSAGSFFTNPVLDAAAFAALEARARERLGPDARVPRFPQPDGTVKTSAAWLIERAGFARGHGDPATVAISGKHTLALTNRGAGTTAQLVALAREIAAGVEAAFGVRAGARAGVRGARAGDDRRPSGTGPGGPQDSSPGAGNRRSSATGFVRSSTTLPVLPIPRTSSGCSPSSPLTSSSARGSTAAGSARRRRRGRPGLRAAELAGRCRARPRPSGRPAEVARALRSGLAVSDTLSLRLRLVRRDGSLLRADVRFDAVRDADGALAEHHVTIRDASDRRRSDELRAQWEVLFRVTRRGIAVTDPRTQVLVAVNPAYAAMHGGEVEDFVGLPVACVLAPGSAARLDGLGEEIDEHGFLSYDSEHVRTDGSVFPAAIEMMAARDEDGAAALLAHVGRGPHGAPARGAGRRPPRG